MLCSIIIPLYNKEAFIDYALQSILRQRHQNFEIIVVDDGSTDNGAYRVSAIQDQRIHLIQQVNAGVSCARNTGIECAKGELVCFLDADDWYHPLYLETIVSMAERYLEIDFFATRFLMFKDQDLPTKTWELKGNNDVLLIDDLYEHFLVFGFTFCTNTVGIRREFLNACQPCFPPSESMGEDLDLWFRLSEKSPIAYCQLPLAAYRQVTGSLCDINKVSNSLFAVFSRIEWRAQHGQMPVKLRSSALKYASKAKETRARNLLIAGQRYDAYKALLEGLPQGLRSRRWWVSLLLCATLPPSFARRWEYWREPEKRA
jgi:glycosyltransferase involved in cell wall biosynthesis